MSEPTESAAPSPTAAPQPVRDPWGLRESGELVRSALRLLRQHWVALLTIALAAEVAHLLLAEVAVPVARIGPVPSFLILALMPLTGVAGIVGMLLVLRSRESGPANVGAVLGVVGSVLVPFLVVYDSRGDLRLDLTTYVGAAAWDQVGDGVPDVLPQIGSWLVLGIVVVAFLVRALGGRIVHRVGTGDDDPRRGALQVVTGYAEAVWVTLGAFVLTAAFARIGVWWSTRVVGHSLFSGWEQIREALPTFGAFGDWVASMVPVLTDAAVTGLVVPLAVLTIAVIVYARQIADDAVSDAATAVTGSRAVTRVSRRVGSTPVQLAWGRLAEPDGRFGAMLSGVTLVLRSGFVPVLVYCVLYVAVQHVDALVWSLARLVLGFRDEIVWEAWYNPLESASDIVALMLTVVLTAVFADRLLTRVGAAGQLKERPRGRQGSGNSRNVASPKISASTRTDTSSASDGTSTIID